MLDAITIQQCEPEIVYTQSHTVLDRILDHHTNTCEWDPSCLKGITPSTFDQIKESRRAPYYIPYGLQDYSLGLVRINLKFRSVICIKAEWDLDKNIFLPTHDPGSIWFPERVWHKSYSNSGTVPRTEHWGPVFLCKPGITHIIDEYWFLGPHQLAWSWGAKLSYDDNFQELQDDFLHQLDAQTVVLSPSAAAALAGLPDPQ